MRKLNKKLLEENIAKISNEDIERKKLTGSAYAVYQKDNIDFRYYAGKISAEDENKIKGNTLFRIASMSKPITAAAVMILAQKGLIDIDDKAEKYIPSLAGIHVREEIEGGGYNDLGPTPVPITIRHLLTHTSGFGSCCMTKFARLSKDDKASLDGTINFYIKEGVDFIPGSRQHYSAFAAFDLLCKIAETVTGESFDVFVKKNLFDPCGMVDTTFSPTKEQNDRIIPMHSRVEDKNVVDRMIDGCVFEDFPYSHKMGGAGFVSTVDDYVAFAKMLLNKGKCAGKTLIEERFVKELGTASVSEEVMPGPQKWGLGVRVITGDEYKILPTGSFGWSGAYGSHFWVDPVNEIIAVFMKNSRIDGGSGNESAVKFENAVFDSLE